MSSGLRCVNADDKSATDGTCDGNRSVPSSASDRVSSHCSNVRAAPGNAETGQGATRSPHADARNGIALDAAARSCDTGLKLDPCKTARQCPGHRISAGSRRVRETDNVSVDGMVEAGL